MRGRRERIKTLTNLLIKLLPGILGHKPEHGEKRPAKIVKVCIAVVGVPAGAAAFKCFRTAPGSGNQGGREGGTVPHGLACPSQDGTGSAEGRGLTPSRPGWGSGGGRTAFNCRVASSCLPSLPAYALMWAPTDSSSSLTSKLP